MLFDDESTELSHCGHSFAGTFRGVMLDASFPARLDHGSGLLGKSFPEETVQETSRRGVLVQVEVCWESDFSHFTGGIAVGHLIEDGEMNDFHSKLSRCCTGADVSALEGDEPPCQELGDRQCCQNYSLYSAGALIRNLYILP